MVYIAFRGSRLSSGYCPPAIVTIIVSPIALENPKINEAIIPDKAAGSILVDLVKLVEYNDTQVANGMQGYTYVRKMRGKNGAFESSNGVVLCS